MKNLPLILVSLILFSLISCDQEENLTQFDADIVITVPGFNSTSVTTAIFAMKVKSLGHFTIGICCSETANPTTEDIHKDIEVNTDTLIIDNLTLNLNLTGLKKGTRYYIRGYIKAREEVHYSPQVEFTTSLNTLNVEVSDDYVPDGYEYWLVLSDNTEILEVQKLENSKTYSFSDDLPDLTDMHIYRLNYAYNRYYLSIMSYSDITPDEFFLDNISTPVTIAGQASITVSDMANFLNWGVSATNWSTYTTSSTRTNLTASLTKDPDNLFISYIPSDGSAPGYKYLNSVTPSSSYNFVMSDFIKMSEFLQITLPANNRFYYYLNGYNTDYYNDNIRFHGHTYTSGYNGTLKLYYPVGIRSKFFLYTYYTNLNQSSYYIRHGLQSVITYPEFPGITLSNTAQLGSATSAVNEYSRYEVLNMVGYYTGSTLSLTWNYYAKPGSQNNAPVPEVPSEIIQKIGAFSTTQIPLTNVGYFDLINGQITSYSDFIDKMIRQSGNMIELVSEYRIFSMSPGAKSDAVETESYFNAF